VIITAIVYSSILTLLCMGFTLQYIIMGVPNLAHATIAFSASYITLIVSLLGVSPYFGVPIAAIYGGTISLLLYKFLAFLRNRGTSVIGLMISTLVFDLIIYACMNIAGEILSRYFNVYAASFMLSRFDFSIRNLPGVLFVSIILSFSLIIFFHLFLTKTKFGIAMRAIMENYSLAYVDGVDVPFVEGVAWFIVGTIAGVAGSLYPLWFNMDPMAGFWALSPILAGSIVGGVRSVYGSLLGGFLIANCEIFLTYLLSIFLGGGVWAFRAFVAMSIACLALLLMPEGLAELIKKIQLKGGLE